MGTAQKKPVIWLALLLAYSACAFALDPSLDVNQYAHTSWTIREGFTTGSIFAITQTPDGYLWLGTESGLFRFGGVQPVPWQPPNGAQLPSNWIHTLLVTRDGTLWIGTHKGLAGWKDGKLTEYPEASGHRVTSLLQDAEGTLWFGVEDAGRVCAVRAAGTQCYGTGNFGGSIFALYEDHKGNLWISAQTGLWRWAPGLPKHYTLPGKAARAHALLEDDNGVLVMATSDSFAGNVVSSSIEGLKQLVGGEIRSYPLPVIGGQFRPTYLLRSRDGSLWIGTTRGLLHLHQKTIDRFDGLSGGTITGMFEDREGTVWVSTQAGLDRFREFAAPTISENQGLSRSAAGVIEATPDGSVWIATAGGLNRWQNGHVTVYNEGGVQRQNRPTDEQERIIDARVTQVANSGLRNAAYGLGQDDWGRLWVGGREGVLYFDRGRFVPVPGVPGGNILSITGDGRGKVWISNNEEGLFYWTPDGPVQRIPWSRFGHQYGATALLPDRSQGGLWLGFTEGGIAYLKDGRVNESWNSANGLGNGSVNDLQTAPDGAVWAATEGGLSRLGLSRVKDGRVLTLASGNGLPCDSVNSVIEDDEHALWLYMPCGLVRIARSELDAWVSDSKQRVRTTVFDNSDGVWSRGLNGSQSRLVAKSTDGKIWFSPPDGFSFIDPRHIPINKLAPPVHIEQIVADRKLRWQNLSGNAASNLRLPALSRDLEIDYTALSLVAPEKIRFKYKLEGYDSDWQDAGNRRQAFYSNLSPQNYRFRVMASNNSGVWNEAGDSLEFSIAPAYYQNNWFRVSSVAGLLLLLWGLYRYRLHQVAREFNANLEGRVEERMRVARELHDTLLQSFNGLLPRFQAAYNLLPGRTAEARHVLETALDDAGQAITEARDAVQDLRTSTVMTNDLAKAVKAAGEDLAVRQGAVDGGAPAFSVEVEGAPQDLHPILRDEIYRIASEALRNAFHHARARRIEVEIRNDARHLRVRVRDDGVGIHAGVLSEEGRAGHFGLQGMRERAKHIGGQLEIWTQDGAGTEVELTVPASVAHVGRRFRLFKSKVGTSS